MYKPSDKSWKQRPFFHLHCLFLISQDWQLCKDNPVPSWDLFNKKLHNTGVQLNLAREIYGGRLLFPILGCIMTNTPALMSTLAPTSTPALTPMPAPTFIPIPSHRTAPISTSALKLPMFPLRLLCCLRSPLSPRLQSLLLPRNQE